MVVKNQCNTRLVGFTRRDFIKYTSFALSSLPITGLSKTMCELERDKCLKAKYHLKFASPYNTQDWRFAPHLHHQFKENIELASKGEIFVDIIDDGQLGIGTEIASLVARGQVQAGLISVSNLSPAAPIVDILNIPFWSASNQNYLNLVSSDVWKDKVLNRVASQGKLEILYHHITGARTITSTKLHGAVLKRPSDLSNMLFRTPSSHALDIFYRLLGTTPVKVKWKNAAQAAAIGRIQGLDPSIVGLYNGPNNLRQQLGSITLINSVHDGWVTIINQNWLQKLPNNLRDAVKEASNKTFKQHINTAELIQKNSKEALKKLGVSIYQPTVEELSVWRQISGHHKKQWLPYKEQLLGDSKAFNQFYDAANVTNKRV